VLFSFLYGCNNFLALSLCSHGHCISCNDELIFSSILPGLFNFSDPGVPMIFEFVLSAVIKPMRTVRLTFNFPSKSLASGLCMERMMNTPNDRPMDDI